MPDSTDKYPRGIVRIARGILTRVITKYNARAIGQAAGERIDVLEKSDAESVSCEMIEFEFKISILFDYRENPQKNR